MSDTLESRAREVWRASYITEDDAIHAIAAALREAEARGREEAAAKADELMLQMQARLDQTDDVGASLPIAAQMQGLRKARDAIRALKEPAP